MGRLEYRPKRIKAETLPYDNVDVTKLLDQLLTKGFIVVYRYENEYYLEIPTFTQHQNCHIKEAESTIPAPCENESCTVAVGPLSSFLLPLTESPLPKTRAKRIFQDERFQKFWNEYPRKVAKGEAEKAWGQINPSQDLLDKIIANIKLGKESWDWKKDGGQFIPYPASWLRAKGWENEYRKDQQQPPSDNPADASADKIIQEWEKRHGKG
jgi:hypothetical protein